MTEPTDEQIIARGHHAKRILDDELFQESVLAAEETIIREWRNTEPGPAGAEKREECHSRLYAINSVVFEIRRVMDGGEFLKGQQEKKERREQ